MKMYSAFLFVLCLNISAFIISQSGMIAAGQELSWSAADILAKFSWQNLIISLGVGGAVAGITMLITRQFVYATSALIIWAISSVAPILEWFVLGVPLILDSLLGADLWYIGIAVRAFFALIFFMFIIETATQRQIT